MALALGALEAGDNCTFFREQRDYEAAMLKRINTVAFAIAIKEWGATAAAAVGSAV